MCIVLSCVLCGAVVSVRVCASVSVRTFGEREDKSTSETRICETHSEELTNAFDGDLEATVDGIVEGYLLIGDGCLLAIRSLAACYQSRLVQRRPSFTV